MNLSDKTRHFFHVVSNIRPIFWIGLYVCLMPVFATIYWALPDSQFRIPDGAATDWGSWLYYSIVTITTLGFGDYTPAHGWAQAVTAIEVGCGLVFLGFFLNAVGAMKSEIDVESEVEKQRLAHLTLEMDKMLKLIPSVIHSLSVFLAYCYAVTTPDKNADGNKEEYNPDFTFRDMRDLFKPSGLPIDHTYVPAVGRLLKSASQTCLVLDSLQSKVDLTLWPQVLEDCFGFVANYQMFSNSDLLFSETGHFINDQHINSRLTNREGRDLIGIYSNKAEEERLANLIGNYEGDLNFPDHSELQPIGELYYFIKENAEISMRLENLLSVIATEK